MARKIKKTDKGKAWARRQMSAKPYELDQREVLKSFLIICEGQNTEPAYFKSFPLGNAQVEAYGMGSSKTALVNQVLNIIAEESADEDLEVWVVFDFDVNEYQKEQQKIDYNQAIAKAMDNGLRVACSNDSFELWFLLHYQLLESPWSRHQYYDRLSELWDCNYEKAGKRFTFCRGIYRRLEEDERASQANAMNHASRLDTQQGRLPFAERNPHTSVYELVSELNVYL